MALRSLKLLSRVGVAVIMTAAPARAVVSRPAEVVNSWALAPSGASANEPSSRVFLSYDVAPGTVLHDSVTLWNYSNVQLTFHLYSTDAFNNNQGAFTLLTADQRAKDVGSWISLATGNVTAAPHTKVAIPLTVTVPADAHPGDHAGAVLASSEIVGTGPNGNAVAVDRRTGTRVYLRVAGPVHPQLVVDAIHSSYHGSWNPLSGRLDVAYSVRNVGNVRLSGKQVLKASGIFGLAAKKRQPADIPELLPGNAVVLHQQFHGLPALLRDQVAISLTPGAHARPTTRTAQSTAIPWSVVLLGLAASAAWRYRARRS